MTAACYCRVVHGTRDEVQCRFCLSALPAWKPVLRASLDKVDPSSVLPIVAVVYGGQEYRWRTCFHAG
jgi:hypothetical protein